MIVEYIVKRGGYIWMENEDWIFSKLPNWLWSLVLPFAIMLGVILPAFFKFLMNNTDGIIINIIIKVLFI